MLVLVGFRVWEIGNIWKVVSFCCLEDWELMKMESGTDFSPNYCQDSVTEPMRTTGKPPRLRPVIRHCVSTARLASSTDSVCYSICMRL